MDMQQTLAVDQKVRTLKMIQTILGPVVAEVAAIRREFSTIAADLVKMGGEQELMEAAALEEAATALVVAAGATISISEAFAELEVILKKGLPTS